MPGLSNKSNKKDKMNYIKSCNMLLNINLSQSDIKYESNNGIIVYSDNVKSKFKEEIYNYFIDGI